MISHNSSTQITKQTLPKLCLFDLDGTLIKQDLHHFYETYCLVYRIMNRQAPSFENFLNLAKKLNLFQDIPEKERDAFKKDFWKKFNETYEWPLAKEIKGAITVLDQLVTKGSKIAIVTARNKLPKEVENTLQRTGLLKYISILSTLGEDHLKGHPDKIIQIIQVCKKLSTEPKDSFMAGDHPSDIESGKKAGCQLTIGISSGNCDKEILANAKPNILLDSITYLPDYFT